MTAIVLSLGVGRGLHLGFHNVDGVVHLTVQVGADQVADVVVSADELAALRELVDAVRNTYATQPPESEGTA